MISVQGILTASALLFLLSCGSSEDNTPVEPNFSSIQTLVFNKSCVFASCHNTAAHMGNLDLSAGKSYDALFNIPASNISAHNDGKIRVVPNEPDNSFLVQKLEGPGPGEGLLMPRSNGHLPQQKIDAIRQWISEGALQN